MQELSKMGVFVSAKEQGSRLWKQSKFEVAHGRVHRAKELDLLTSGVALVHKSTFKRKMEGTSTNTFLLSCTACPIVTFIVPIGKLKPKILSKFAEGRQLCKVRVLT